MQKKWMFVIRDHNLNRIAIIDRVLSWDGARAENDKGAFTLLLPPTHSLELFAVDNIIEFWRSEDDGKTWKLDGKTCWFIRDAFFSWDGGKEAIEITGHDTLGLIDRRIVSWYAVANAELAQNYYSKKTGPADQAIWELFYENLGAGVVGYDPLDVPASVAGDSTTIFSPTDRQMTLISMEDMPSQAPLISLEFAWKSVLTAMKDVANASAAQDYRLIFDIEYDPDSPMPFVFKIWGKLRGVDRTTGDNRVIFSRQHENVASISLRQIHSDEATWIHVGGSGQGSLRIMQAVASEQGSFRRSPFYPIEGFIENTKTADQATLQSTGEGELFRRRARFEFSGEAKDGPTTAFGRTYDYGDRVLCEHRGVVGVTRISRYRTTLSAGHASIAIPFETEENTVVD